MKLKTNIKWLLAICMVFTTVAVSHAGEPDTVKIRKLNERASALYFERVLDSAQKLAERANAMVNESLNGKDAGYGGVSQEQMKLLKAHALHILALSIEYAEPKAAIDSLKVAINLMEATVNTQELAELYLSMAGIYDFQVQNDLALKYYNRSIDLYRKAGDLEGQAMVLTNIGITYRDMGNYGEAMEVLLESLGLYRSLNDSIDAATTLLAIGFVYLMVHEWENALEVQEQALEIYRNLGD